MTSYTLGNPAVDGLVRAVVYDKGNRILGFTHTGAANASSFDQTFSYDGLDRLTSFTAASKDLGYAYDLNGNRTHARIGTATYTNAIASGSNRMTSAGGAAAKSYGYDLAGNITSDGTATYEYSDRGRLKRVTRNAVATSYLYNGLDQRVSKTGTAVAGGVNYYAYDQGGLLLGEYGASGAAVQETIYFGSTPVAVITPRGLYYIHADHIDTPRVITDSTTNKVVWRWDQADPFGSALANESPTGQSIFAYNPRFPGQLFDAESKLHYNYFRDYDPQTGRYIQSDPIGLAGGLATFSYVGNSPLIFTDRFGLKPGDPYNSANAAAIAALRDIFSLTASQGVEYSGRVLRTPNGKYTYTNPSRGNSKDIGKMPPDICPPQGTNEGVYHTHPEVVVHPNGTNNPNTISNPDQFWADHEHVPAFIVGPNGNIMKYTPNGIAYGGPVIIIGKIK